MLFGLSLVASLFLAGSIMFFSRRMPGYDHVTQTISELGEHGSAFEKTVSLGVFLPLAVALSVVTVLLHESHTPIALLSLSIALGYGISAFFPCDPGSPLYGSWRQAVHNIGGGIEYVGGALSLFWLAESWGPSFRMPGVVVAVAAVLLSFKGPFRGVIQRVAELCLFGGLVAALWIIK